MTSTQELTRVLQGSRGEAGLGEGAQALLAWPEAVHMGTRGESMSRNIPPSRGVGQGTADALTEKLSVIRFYLGAGPTLSRCWTRDLLKILSP